MADFKTTWWLKLKDSVVGPLDKIIAKAGGAEKAIAKIELRNQRLEEMSGKLQSKLTKLAVGGAAFLALSYGSLQFEKSMAMTNTMAQKTGREYELLTDKVRGIAEAVPVARDELANGLYSVISAGVPEDNWIDFLNDSSKAAIGGNSELGTVVDATAGIIKNYSLAWSEANEIQDKFQKTVELGQIPGLNALATALPRVAGAANHLKVSQDELMSSFATFTGVTGPTTNEVATQIQALFNSLMKPSAEAKKLAKDIGITWNSTAIASAGGMKQFAELVTPAITQYAQRMKMTEDEVIGALTGSAEALKPLQALMGDVGDTFEANTAKLSGAVGAVDRAFGFATDNVTDRLQTLRNEFSNNMDRIVASMMPLFEAGMAVFGGLVSAFSWFQETFPVLSKWATLVGGAAFVTTFLGLVLGVAGLKLFAWYGELKIAAIAIRAWTGWSTLATAATTAWTTVTGFASTAFATLNAVIAANPIGALVVALIAVTTLVIAAVRHWNEWGAALSIFLGPLGMVISLVQSFRRNWELLTEAFSTGGMLEGIKAIGKVLLDSVIMPVQQLLEIVSRVTGAEWAENAAKSIEKFRNSLGVKVEQGTASAATSERATPTKETRATGSKFVAPGSIHTQTETAATSNGAAAAISGGSGGGGSRVVHQKNEFQITFVLPKNWREEKDNIRDEFLEMFTKASGDAAIAATK
jgi:TP901 family phage tail tape measure protein